ncbi:MAG: malonic semialdehyde reductase [Rickettsiaceae bacterium]
MKNIQEVFNEKTCYAFSDKAVDLKLLRRIYDVMKLGPTSANSCPLRMVFVHSKEEKEKLYQCLSPGNIEKTKSAPITTILAHDDEFYKKMTKLFPHSSDLMNKFAQSKELAHNIAMQNSLLQAAYFMITARGFGLQIGPMGGFNKDAINEKFFNDDSNWRVNFLCNLGYAKNHDNETSTKSPRLEFDETCKII